MATPTSQRAEQRLAHPGGLSSSSPLRPPSPPRTLHGLTQLQLRPFPLSSLLPHLFKPPGQAGPRSSCHPSSAGQRFPPLYRLQHPKTAERGCFAPHSLAVPIVAAKTWPTDHMVGISTAMAEAETSGRELKDCATSDIPVPLSIPPSLSGTTERWRMLTPPSAQPHARPQLLAPSRN